MLTVNFQMFNLVLEKAEEPEIKLPTSVGSLKKICFCFIDYNQRRSIGPAILRDVEVVSLFLPCEFGAVQSLSHIRLFATTPIAAHQASLSITNSWSLLKLTSIKSVMPTNRLILCRLLLLLP